LNNCDNVIEDTKSNPGHAQTSEGNQLRCIRFQSKNVQILKTVVAKITVH